MTQSPHPLERFPTERSALMLAGPAGDLECVCDVPDDHDIRPTTIVICHPHPQHGGSMQNKGVTSLERSMRELGLRTVRFNFRGVGASEGEFDDGDGETDDLLAVVEWVQRTRPSDELWLGGFSFGAYVSLKAAQSLQLGQLISIAPPVGRYEFSELPHPGCPWLVVQGDRDELVDIDQVRSWAATLEPEPNLAVMELADHFFHHRLMDLRSLLKNGVRARWPDASA